MSGVAKGGTKVTFGDYGIQALEPGWITNRQIEAARIAMTRYIKRGGKVWISIFPDKPITQKPAETRMGSGKGNPEHWVAVVKPGRVMFELSGRAGAASPARRCGSRCTSCRSRPASSCDRKRRRDARSKAAELRELNDAELVQRLAEAKEEHFNLRFQNATGQLDNSAATRRRPPGDRAAATRCCGSARSRRPRPAPRSSSDRRPRAPTTEPRNSRKRARGPRRVREDGQDRRRRGRRPRAAPPLPQDAAAHPQALRPRRGERGPRGRPRPHRRDAGRCRVRSAGASWRSWSVRGDPAGVSAQGGRQLGRPRGAVHQGARRHAAPLRRRSATSSSRPSRTRSRVRR